jgi:hypothetical protein
VVGAGSLVRSRSPFPIGVDWTGLGTGKEEVQMSRLVRLDPSGHTELAEWGAADGVAYDRASELFREQLGVGYMGVAKLADDSYEQVKELPRDVELVILRRPIAGG